MWSAFEALQRRLDAPAVVGEELRGSLDELRARVGELAETIDQAPDADRLAALEAVVSDLSALDEISTRLDVLARGAARREDVDALREALDRDVEALRDALATNRTDDLDERFTQFDAALTELQQRVAARDTDEEHARLERQVAARLAESHAVSEDLGRRIDEALGRIERTEDDASSAARLAGELAARLEEVVPAERVAAVEERLSQVGRELGERIDGLHGALGEVSLEALRDEVQQSVLGLDERITVLQVQLDAAGSDRRDVDRIAEELRAELDRTRRGLEELVERVGAEGATGLEERLAETVSRVELGALAGDLHGRLELIEAVLADELANGRLGALDTQVTEVAAAVADVDRRLAEIATRVDGAIGRDEAEQKVAEQVAAASSALTSRLEESVSTSNDRLAAVEHELAEVDGRAARSVEAVREVDRVPSDRRRLADGGRCARRRARRPRGTGRGGDGAAGAAPRARSRRDPRPRGRDERRALPAVRSSRPSRARCRTTGPRSIRLWRRSTSDPPVRRRPLGARLCRSVSPRWSHTASSTRSGLVSSRRSPGSRTSALVSQEPSPTSSRRDEVDERVAAGLASAGALGRARASGWRRSPDGSPGSRAR